MRPAAYIPPATEQQGTCSAGTLILSEAMHNSFVHQRVAFTVFTGHATDLGKVDDTHLILVQLAGCQLLQHIRSTGYSCLKQVTQLSRTI